MSAAPPLGGFAPGLICTRWTDGDHCGRPATFHIFWTDDAENGLACDDHMIEALARWTIWTSHAYDPICSIPGAWVMVPDDGGPSYCCVPDDDDLAVAEALTQTVPA